VETIKAKGLRVSTRSSEHHVQVPALHIFELQSVAEPFDMAFIAVKSYDTEWATRLAQGYVKPDGAFVDFQNGINDDRVAEIVGQERTLGCVITISSGIYEPGKALRTDQNPWGFAIGELDGKETPRAREIADMMGAVAQASVTTNLWGERWSKLMINCMNNALAGISGYGTAKVRTEPETRRIGIQLGAEVVRVARAHGQQVQGVMGISPDAMIDAAEGRNVEAVESQILEIARLVGSGGRPSFLQDVLKKRRTEIEFLNGYVARKGEEKGVAMPFNRKITEIVTELGVGFEPDPAHIAPLSTMLP